MSAPTCCASCAALPPELPRAPYIDRLRESPLNVTVRHAFRSVIRGARTHNLRNIDLELPRDRLIVFTGLSGLGQVLARVRHASTPKASAATSNRCRPTRGSSCR